MIIILNRLALDGTLQTLLKCGIMSWKIVFYRDLFLQYDIYMKKGYRSMEAKQFTADSFKVTIRTVEKAIKLMNEPCK